MKKIPIFLVTLSILVSCGEKEITPLPDNACVNVQFLGTWYDTASNDVMTFRENCTAVTTECGYFIRYSYPNSTDQINVTITGNNGGELCLDPATYVCEVDVEGTVLTFDCGTGLYTYER